MTASSEKGMSALQSDVSPFTAWLSATRPATLTAAVGPVVVASALAAADQRFSFGPSLAALFGAIMIQIGTNFYNDHADFARGADTEDRLGPPRAVQQGWLSSRQVLGGAAVAFLLAALAGVYLITIGGIPILVLGLVSIVAGLAYTGGPMPLAYVGLGDIFVLAFFGIGAVGGTYYLHAGTITLEALAASIAIGTLATAILAVNNLRDRHTDVAANKRTLVVRFGRRFGVAEHSGLMLVAYLIVGAMALRLQAWGWLLPLLSAPLAVQCARVVARSEGADLNPQLGATARVGLLFSALLAVGVLL